MEKELRTPLPMYVGGSSKIPRVDYCMTCEEELGKVMDPQEKVGPYNHLSVFPDHKVITVHGSLEIWRT